MGEERVEVAAGATSSPAWCPSTSRLRSPLSAPCFNPRVALTYDALPPPLQTCAGSGPSGQPRPAPARLGHATTAVGSRHPSLSTALPAQMCGIEDGMACEPRRAGLGAPMAITAPTAAGRQLRFVRPLAGACGLRVRRLAVLQPLALLLPFWCARGWVAMALESGPAGRSGRRQRWWSCGETLFTSCWWPRGDKASKLAARAPSEPRTLGGCLPPMSHA
ncbi:unnamed protein product [Urochloa humidicola]